uniref:Uncharacterized protein n=1 Tax=Lotharella globosa TaxID=91324 RepID=A0A7S3YWZ9_9EUKA|mmetsp:Transcript_24497/g.47819  ORF Transcript_24497/g.47819 Transcript_24497/m.47819 type:complete len:272 (+) Transcript_24497:78-893(+)
MNEDDMYLSIGIVVPIFLRLTSDLILWQMYGAVDYIRSRSSTESKSFQLLGESVREHASASDVNISSVLEKKYAWGEAAKLQGYSVAMAVLVATGRLIVYNLMQPAFFIAALVIQGDELDRVEQNLAYVVLSGEIVGLIGVALALYSNPTFIIVNVTSQKDGEFWSNLLFYVGAPGMFAWASALSGFRAPAIAIVAMLFFIAAVNLTGAFALFWSGLHNLAWEDGEGLTLPLAISIQYCYVFVSCVAGVFFVFWRLLPCATLALCCPCCWC